MKFLYIYHDPNERHPTVVVHPDDNPMSYQNMMVGVHTLKSDKEMVSLLRQLKIGAYCNDNRTRAVWVRVE